MTEGYSYEELTAMFEAVRADIRAKANGHQVTPSGEWVSPTPLVDWVEAYGIGDDPAHWLAEPLLPDAGSVAIFAKGGTGKSLLALWLAAGLATGQGLVGPIEPIEVLYLDYEMTLNTVVERLEDMGYTDPVELDRLHYASLPSLAPLDTAAGGRAVVDMAGQLKVGLVVIDTFGRAVDGEEDRADTVRAWYRWTGQLLKTAGIGFLRIDHAGKDVKRGQRGTSAKNDDVDVVWEMTERGHGEFLLRATKRRVSWVDERVVLTQARNNGVLAYHWADNAVTYLTGTKDVAAQLDELGAPVDISRRKAMALLRRAGQGRDNNVVGDALRYRREALNTTPQYHPNAGSGGGANTTSPDDASPQVIPPAYQSIPPAPRKWYGGEEYEVLPQTTGVSGGLFDPSTDPENEGGEDVPDA